jgi:SNF2 family DNA or RNA helicase
MSFIKQKPKWEPHPYQLRALELMVTEGAAGLFLDPGLGKTSTTLCAFDILKAQDYVARMLVIAPMRVCYNVWPNEVKKWSNFSHLKVNILHGRHKEDALNDPADIYVINPEGLPWLTANDRLKRINPEMLVVDESTKFKKTSSKRFKILKKLLHRFSRRYILTGTPTAQGLEDLFGQIYILDGGNALGSYITHYRNKYFYQTGYGGYTYAPREGAEDEIANKIAPFTLRLKAEDYLELPELVFNTIKVSMPEEQRAAYQALEEEFIATINEVDILAPTAAAVSMKLRQLVNGGLYDESGEVVEVHDEKAKALVDLYEEIGGASMLVLYQFKHDIDRICAAFKTRLPHIGSGVSARNAEALCEQFNDGKLPILLAHPASVGHGLNLQGHSNHVVFFGLPWDLEQYEQAVRRVYRQGNPNTHVFIHDIAMRGTIDTAVARALRTKGANQESFLQALKQYSGE